MKLSKQRKELFTDLKAFMVIQNEQNGHWDDNQLKKKKLARIAEAFDVLTCDTVGLSLRQIETHVSVLQSYKLITKFELRFISGAVESEASLTIVLSELGEQVAELLYGVPQLPPFDLGKGITFSVYCDGINVSL
jgi:hypothetical protein